MQSYYQVVSIVEPVSNKYLAITLLPGSKQYKIQWFSLSSDSLSLCTRHVDEAMGEFFLFARGPILLPVFVIDIVKLSTTTTYFY